MQPEEASVVQETLRPKRLQHEETPEVVAEPTLVIDITDAPEAPPIREHLLLLGARVLDPDFIVADIS